MKKLFSIACVLACSLAMHAQVAFQMDLEVSGRAHWGYIPMSSTGITCPHEGGIAFLNLGGNNTITGGPGVNLDLGLRFSDVYFIGVGAQFEANFGKTKASLGMMNADIPVQVMNLCLPIYGVFKMYFPVSSDATPYIDLGVGGYLPDWYQLKADVFAQYPLDIPVDSKTKIDGDKIEFQSDKGGFYFHAAAGVDVNHFQVSAGYELSTASDDTNTRLYHNVFVKVGFRIGG
ncbi:MAG: porin family protein [Paludibacteraceae bacterium]|nr:porin family protein [Paludibacteraceae bacterium]